MTASRIGDPWGDRTPYACGAEWPQRADVALCDGIGETAVDKWVESACVLCSTGCGLQIGVKDGRIAGVRGRADDRVNHGRLGPKGLYGWQANNAPDRLVRPLVRGTSGLAEADWETAMSVVAERARRVLAEQGALAFGFYTTGQLFLEEYYTLAVLARGGIGTPHLDGNTRLCTATASAALKETFSMDGAPGSYRDIDECDTLLLVGHNMAETQTVLWSRVLDRLDGPQRPRLVVIDPRRTPTAERADVHLPVRNGANLPLLNAILHELIRNDWVDHDFVREHTVGFVKLKQTVEQWPAERAAELCDVAAADIREAARLVGTSERLVSSCLQGVYQSHEATASACQVNNINLVRGMIGRPGCTVFQMNGQPSAQNARECGANGDLPGFRNWANPLHVAELAAIWNVEPLQIPHWSPPTHAMQIFRLAEEAAITFLWITATNPAVSLPELRRIRSIVGQDRVFVVVSDAFLTETAQFADVVLPAALWGEKTGCLTNADRTVHISDQAVEPPGEARSDLAMLVEFANRLGLRDRDGAPLIRWSTPEEAFEAWKACSAGRPCDYSGMTYERLRAAGGIQWPCNDEHPHGLERLYCDHRFHTWADRCEDYGHDFVTGAPYTESDYKYVGADGRAILRDAEHSAPAEAPDADYPFSLTTGRRLFHFHTRTKTGRVPELDAAAPSPWVELSAADAERLGVRDGDIVDVESPRGAVRVPVRVGELRQGTVFMPFHYGYWDAGQGGASPDGAGRAANELTMTAWDPVSRQPVFKVAAVRITPTEASR